MYHKLTEMIKLLIFDANIFYLSGTCSNAKRKKESSLDSPCIGHYSPCNGHCAKYSNDLFYHDHNLIYIKCMRFRVEELQE